MSWPPSKRLADLALWLPIAAYAVLVTRSFFHYADRAVALSTDDGVANIAYALAMEGRYGFLTSPVLVGMARDQGLFSYGPFYFYFAALLIWLFGYSLTLLRAIHLGVILVAAVTARAWFGRAGSSAAGALVAVGLLVVFERGQWPMVRPDSFVTLFGLALVVCAGLAIHTGRARFWFGAGLAAACGALTHLVAWSLVPVAVAMVGVGIVASAIDDDGRWRRPPAPWRPVTAAAAGGLVAAILFYASFGFRVRDQIAFLADYQRYTGSLGEVSAPFWSLVLRHFKAAYWYLPYPMEYGVWATLAAAVGCVLFVLARGAPAWRRQVLAMVAPPLIVWAGYLLSLGGYNNFHGGYTILNQVMWLWTGGAVLAIVLQGLDAWPGPGRLARAAAWLAAFTLAVGVLTLLAQRTDYRAIAANALVSIDEYTDRVLDALPAGARAWGTVELGIEHPTRVQLVQFWDGIKIVETLDPQVAAPLAPDYLVWGAVENGLHARAVLAAVSPTGAGEDAPDGPRRLSASFPEARYRPVTLTAGHPYGVTRVYAWATGAPLFDRPIVSIYSAQARQWHRGLGPEDPVSMRETDPGRVRRAAAGGEPDVTALRTLAGELAPGVYLLRVTLDPVEAPPPAAAVVASATPELREEHITSGTDLDVSPVFVGAAEVFLLYHHPGGPFYLSQFGTGVPVLAAVAASRVLPLPDYAERRRPAPEEHPLPASQWTASFPEIQVEPSAPGSVTVVGNTVQYGYQAYGPAIEVEPGQRVRLRVPISVSEGAGCLGVLDETRLRWLVAPDRLEREYEFDVPGGRSVMPVLADCTGRPETIVPLRAVVADGSYATWSGRDELYVDQLMQAFREASRRQVQP